MHSICPLYFSSLVITSEAVTVTRDKVVHALPGRWRLNRGPKSFKYGNAVQKQGMFFDPDFCNLSATSLLAPGSNLVPF